jgi:hypothetical protein
MHDESVDRDWKEVERRKDHQAARSLSVLTNTRQLTDP